MNPRFFLVCFALMGALGCGNAANISDDAGTNDGGTGADAGDHIDSGLLEDQGPEPDAGSMDDAGPGGLDLGMEPPDAGPECVLAGLDPACDDGDDCTDDVCSEGICENPNPSATCGRFEGLPCAETVVQNALTRELSFCLPAFATPEIPLEDLPPELGLPPITVPPFTVCDGEACNDGSDGCELVFSTRVDDVRYVEPPTEAFEFDVAFAQIPEVRVAGSLSLGDLTVDIDCFIGIDLGPGAGAFAELSLDRPPMCSSDRPVDSNVDIGVMTPSLNARPATGTGIGGIINAIACNALEDFAAPLLDLSLITDQLLPLLEGPLALALDGLDCGDCGDECLGGLVCGIGPPSNQASPTRQR